MTLELRRAPKLPAVDRYISAPGWYRLSARTEPTVGPAGTRWIILGTDLPLGRDLYDCLGAANTDVVAVAAGPALHRENRSSWVLDPADAGQYATLLGALDDSAARPLRVVHLWSLRESVLGSLDAQRLAAGQHNAFDTLLALAQGIVQAAQTGDVGIEVLCRGVFDVTGVEPLRPENALLRGIAAVIPQELAHVRCRVLDVSEADLARQDGSAAVAVQAMLSRETAERELALRGSHWWVPGFDPVPVPPPESPGAGLRDAGVYLITGGLGEVGFALAEHIAHTVDTPVLGLLGRTALPAEQVWEEWLASHDVTDPISTRIRRVHALRAAGAQVVALTADVARLAETAAVVEWFRDQAGVINGIIHAAGLPPRGPIVGKTAAAAHEVIAVKAGGAMILDRIFDRGGYDFFLLCSSLSSLVGGLGQSDYAAADAFVDGFAEWRQRDCGTPVCAVAWDTWRGTGMAARLTVRLREVPADPAGTVEKVGMLTTGIEATQALEAFGRIVAMPVLPPRLIVSGARWRNYARRPVADCGQACQRG